MATEVAAKSSRLVRILRRVLFALGSVALITALAFVLNGTSDAWRTPESGFVAVLEPRTARRELRVMAFNAAKCGFFAGGRFVEREVVTKELDTIAQAIVREDCDLVVLSEVVLECGPEPLDQVVYLAQHAGLPHFAASENYSFGVPFFRVRSGNASLSRWPLKALETQQLAGGAPFWNPTNNRRALWCEVEFPNGPLVVAALRNDSFDLANNLVQTREILAWLGRRPALLAGDFNAEPHDPSLELLRVSGRFSGLVDAPPTFPARAPRRRIDHVLAPATWTLLEHHTLTIGASDHLAVVATFAIP
jgi:endonuclease/exonuclease/phosphatase family metal-dependent hydrolase